MATFSPRDLKRRPREAVVMPFPSPEATPPVTKMNFGCVFPTGCEPSRRPRRAGGDRVAKLAPAHPFSAGKPAEPVEPPQRRHRLDRARERHGLREDV